MSAVAERILADLHRVDAERKSRRATPGLQAKVDAVKHFQQRRFSLTYADFLASGRYGPAAEFFLKEIYGPGDFSKRDSQFAKVVPAIVRLFPVGVVNVVSTLAELHSLSEVLDSAMATALQSAEIDANAYVRAWQRSSNLLERERQITLTVSLGRNLDQLTRKPLLHKTLRLMRGAAMAVGLGELQGLLERGFDAFAAMRGAHEFLGFVESRERNLAHRLFSARLEGSADSVDHSQLGLP